MAVSTRDSLQREVATEGSSWGWWALVGGLLGRGSGAEGSDSAMPFPYGRQHSLEPYSLIFQTAACTHTYHIHITYTSYPGPSATKKKCRMTIPQQGMRRSLESFPANSRQDQHAIQLQQQMETNTKSSDPSW